MAITIVTRHMQAAKAAERWKRQYANRESGLGDKDEIERRLRLLGPSPNPDDVDALIGNSSWTSPGDCIGCGCSRPAMAILEHSEDSYAGGAVCLECLETAAAKIREAIQAR